MAETLPEFDFRWRKGSNYPWDEWLNGQIWQLTTGQDFTIAPVSLISSARYEAVDRGMKVRTRRLGEVVVLQAYKPE